MRQLIPVILLLHLHNAVSAQTIRRPVAAEYISTGVYSNSHTDVFSFTANQASLSALKNVSAGIYGERRYMLRELSFYTAAFALPTRSGNFGLKGGYYGSADYNETNAGLAYARKLGSKIDIGVQFNYYGIKVAGYGKAATINAEAGIIMHLTERLNAGIHVFNPAGGKFGKNGDEKLPFVYTAGLGYEASEQFFASMEIEKEEDLPVNVKAVLQYRVLKQLFVRGGVSSAIPSFWMGCGFGSTSFRIDATASYHPQLGVTPGLLLIFNFSKLKDDTTQ